MLKRTRPGIMPTPAYLCLGIAAVLLSSLLFVMSCSEDTTSPDKKPGEPSYCERQPLPASTNTVVQVSSVSQLKDAVTQANSSGDVTIMLADGTYQLDEALFVNADSVTIRSASGNRDQVVISGGGMNGGVVACIIVNGNHFTVADVAIGFVSNNAIQVRHDSDDCLMHNVRFVDVGEFMVRVLNEIGEPTRTERGIIEWCLFEYSVGVEPNSYSGGINAMQTDGWTVHHNSFRRINGTGYQIVGFAILFWYEASNTIVEHNTIYDCDRGVAFGSGGTADSHMGGIIRNNMIHTMDVGIGLESAVAASVYNNSIFVEFDVAAIELRFVRTQNVSIINNLTNGDIFARDGATGVVETNVTDAQRSWFVDAAGGNLRLTDLIAAVIDQGQALTAVEIDFDCEERPKRGEYDIGADEY